jgi:hypothetical protein
MKYSFIDIPFDIINDINLKLLVEYKTVIMYDRNEYRFLGKSIKQVFTENFVNWLDNRNCSIGAVEIWKIPANYDSFWHIDSDPPVDFAKLLLPWNSKSILIEWGKSGAVTDTNRKLNEFTDYPFLGFEDLEVTVTDSAVISGPTIINPSILHRALNQNNEDFYTLNLTLLDKSTGMRLTSTEGANRLMSVL